jgi:hypothetical protein
MFECQHETAAPFMSLYSLPRAVVAPKVELCRVLQKRVPVVRSFFGDAYTVVCGQC